MAFEARRRAVAHDVGDDEIAPRLHGRHTAVQYPARTLGGWGPVHADRCVVHNLGDNDPTANKRGIGNRERNDPAQGHAAHG